MTMTAQLDISFVDPNQTGKAVTVNEAIGALADLWSKVLVVDASANASPYTAPYVAAEGGDKTGLWFLKVKIIGATAADWQLILPAKNHIFAVENATTGGHNVVVKCAGQPGTTVPNGAKYSLFCDGTDCQQFITGAAGSAGAPGAAGLSVTSGAVNGSGHLILTMSDSSTIDVGAVVGPPGANGSNGTNGTNGAPGSVWREGSGVPSNSLGSDGDFYLDGDTGNVYQRASGTYSVVCNIKGPTGATGAATNGLPAGGTAGQLLYKIDGTDYHAGWEAISAVLDTLSATEGAILFRNATAWVALGPGAAGQVLKSGGAGADPSWQSSPYDIACFFPGTPPASQVLLRYTATRALSFPANLSASQGSCATAPTANVSIDVQKNGSAVGTISIAAGATTATFTTAGGAAFSLAAGDVLRLVAPSSADATLANLSITLAGTR